VGEEGVVGGGRVGGAGGVGGGGGGGGGGEDCKEHVSKATSHQIRKISGALRTS